MRIGPFDVPIKEIDVDFEHMGGYEQATSIIVVKKDLPKHTKNEVILHEVIEAITRNNEIEIEHSDLTTLSVNLYQVLRDNGGRIEKWK